MPVFPVACLFLACYVVQLMAGLLENYAGNIKIMHSTGKQNNLLPASITSNMHTAKEAMFLLHKRDM